MLTILLWESLKLLPSTCPLLNCLVIEPADYIYKFHSRRGLSDQYDECRSDICNFLIISLSIFVIGLSQSLFSCWLGNSDSKNNFGKHLLRMVELSQLPCIALLWTMGKRGIILPYLTLPFGHFKN